MNTHRPHEVQDPVVEEYSRNAKVYDTKWSFYVEATIRETMSRFSLRPTDRLLDVGCGTGTLLHRLSATYPGAQLSGVEPVPKMLAIARRRLSPSIELHEGWAERLPFASEQFNHAHFKTYRERECVQLLQEAGYAVVHIDRYRINWLWGMMTARVMKDTA